MKLVQGSQSLGWEIEGRFTQKFIQKTETIADKIREHWNIDPLFISTSFRYNNEHRCTEYFVDRLFFDLDGKHLSLDEAYYDLLKLQIYSDRMGTQTYGFLSNTGIHAHLMIKPFWTHKPQDVLDVKAKITNKLDLKSADWQSFSLAKMPRIPNSVTKNGYAIYIPEGEFPAETLKRSLRRWGFPPRKCEVEFSELQKDLQEETTFKKVGGFVAAVGEYTYENPLTEIFQKPCIRVHISRPDAPAFIRWLAALHLKKKDFTKDETVQFFSKLGWEKFNLKKTQDMVKYAYTYRYAASCARIGSNGLCLGSSCPFWGNRTGL